MHELQRQEEGWREGKAERTAGPDQTGPCRICLGFGSSSDRNVETFATARVFEPPQNSYAGI